MNKKKTYKQRQHEDDGKIYTNISQTVPKKKNFIHNRLTLRCSWMFKNRTKFVFIDSVLVSCESYIHLLFSPYIQIPLNAKWRKRIYMNLLFIDSTHKYTFGVLSNFYRSFYFKKKYTNKSVHISSGYTIYLANTQLHTFQ